MIFVQPGQVQKMENHGGVQEVTPRPQNLYTVVLVLLVFIVMGLMGVLLCHILKEKGYHCRTSRDVDTEPEATTTPDDVQESCKSNQDTVGQIVQCIIQNEANVEALKDLLKEHEQVKSPLPRPLFPELSLTKVPPEHPHHHTVHSMVAGSARSACLNCQHGRKRTALQICRRAKETKVRDQGVEVTVLSVGRFRVIRVEKGRWAHEVGSIPAIEMRPQNQSAATEVEIEAEELSALSETTQTEELDLAQK
ncbi:RELT-like protein 2 isoform X2 [Scyliorhinus canicula]|uniref:RELT-like protein 2 isoform X2 n=1 Tax=Scyliorhinus canicula TaxID=7830 RepID=UPI0018F68F63|nr:RELT-like protein 2 isoform X2 [Scyliorhinus canicula]